MKELPTSLDTHRVRITAPEDVFKGQVQWAPAKSFWFLGMAIAAGVGGTVFFSLSAFVLFLVSTGTVLLLGHSLGSHRKLIHNSFQCPPWLERVLIYCGVQVGLAGPIGLLRQHELRDFAQRLPACHDYFRHGRSFWLDAWWQLNCELKLDRPPEVSLEPRIANDRFLQWLERTWMLQQVPFAILFYVLGGWGWVFWGVCARVTAGVFGHWLIGYFAHNHGGMHYKVRGAAAQGHNVPFAWLLTMGECWHNNHHAFPGSAQLGLFPGERDPGWWVLMLFRKMGLAWGFRLPKDLPPRPELATCDELARTTEDGPCDPNVLRWPGSMLAPGPLRASVGSTPLFLDRASRRLSFHGKTGLPALCDAMVQQGGLRSVVARALQGPAE
ncbi:MAG: acyl-CoA desaturase, partial [Gammaproteobacteria bacterium]